MGIAEDYELAIGAEHSGQNRPDSEQETHLSEANAELNPYIEAVNKPLEYVGYLAKTGEAICRIRWSPERDRFIWTSLVPEDSWTESMHESLFNRLNHLEENKVELTRPLRIRPATEAENL